MTISILARDPATGEFGVATASFTLAVGGSVPRVRAGVGAVAVQAASPLRWGGETLDALSRGEPAAVIAERLAGLPEAAGSQIALIDRHGETSVVCGQGLEPEVCVEQSANVCVAGNLMERPATARRALAAFRSSPAGDLAGCLLDALTAADAEGGDVRGRQSAALLVGKPAPATSLADVDLRVDDARQPVQELRRLHRLRRAHDLLAASRGPDGLYRDVGLALAAHRAAPEDEACLAGAAFALLRSSRVEEAVELLRQLHRTEPRIIARLARLRDQALLGTEPAEQAISRLLAGPTAAPDTNT